MQIIVLGMHRSGTSALTRLINLMGAYVGPESLLGAPAYDNEKGFWERRDVKELNETILRDCGADWDDPGSQDWSARLREGIATARWAGAIRQVVQGLDGHRPWVMKEPRLCLTLPAWRPHLERPVCVIVHRSPVEVARSLKARNGMPLIMGVAIWEAYALAALQASSGLPRLVVRYADLMAQPLDALSSLHAGLFAAGARSLRMPESAEVRAFLDDRLFHQRASETEQEGLLNQAQMRLSAAMADGSALRATEVPQLSRGACDVLDLARERDVARAASRAAQREHEQAAAGWLAEREQLQRDLGRLRGQLQDQEARAAASLQAQQQAFDAVRAELEAQRQAALAQVQTQSQAFALAQTRSESQAGELQSELARVRAMHEALEAQWTQARTAWHVEREGLRDDLRRASSWLRQLEESHQAHLLSWRWRVGHHAVRMAERALRRPAGPLAVEHMSMILRQYRDWLFESAQTRQRAGTDDAAGGGELAGQASGLDERVPVALREALRTGGTQQPDILVFPIIDWHFRIQRPQHLARGLARLGHRVFYFTTRPRSGESEPGWELIESPADGVYLCQLQHDGPALSIYSDGIHQAARDGLLASLALLMHDCGVTSALSIVDLPTWRPVVERLPGVPVVYDCMDHHGGFSTHTPELDREEALLLAAADQVVTTSDWLSQRISDKASHVVIRNGADVAAFAQAAADRRRDPSARPVVGYVGTIAEWFDLPLVVAAARACPQWDFVLVGATHGCDLLPAQGLENVRFLGERPYEEVPGLVASFDVCIIPFRLTELIQATNPVKVYEYLSAGKPVVATALPELQALAQWVHVAADEQAFLACLAQAMSERQDEEKARQRQQWAAGQDWQHRTQALEAVIQGCFPKVSVVVLTYNNWMFTKACLYSLAQFTRYPNWELILVDNGSTDGTPQHLQAYAGTDPRARVILHDSNLGFAAGNNAGMRVADGEFVVVLNNDTYVTEGWLHGLLRHMRRDERLGLVGPVTNNIGNEARIDIHYADMTEMARAARRYTDAHLHQRLPINVTAFFCVMIRRTVLDAIGLLDERFGQGYFEDDDYCRRARDAGFEVAVAEDVFVHHHLSASFNEVPSAQRKALFDRNQAIYEEKWGPWQPHRYRA